MLYKGSPARGITNHYTILKIINNNDLGMCEVEIVDILPQHRLYHIRKEFIDDSYVIFRKELTPLITKIFTKVN